MDTPLVIGQVTGVHPAKRELRIRPVLSRRAEYVALKWAHLRTAQGVLRCRVESVERQSAQEKLVLAATVPRDRIAGLKRAELVVEEADAMPRSQHEFGLAEFAGFAVYSAGERLGRVAGHLDTPQGGFLRVSGPKGETLTIALVPDLIDVIDWNGSELKLHDVTPYAVYDDEPE